jgi:radical SAM protein (TIGR01212 family)
VTSTNTTPPVHAAGATPSWREAGLRYRAYGHYLRGRFGGRVQRVSLDAKFTCPNVDGTVTTGGCVFCDNRSFSPSRRLPRTTIADQLEHGIGVLSRRYKVEQFIAYFQPATNTYAPPERLRPLFFEALEDPRVVGLAVGTRPDCVPDEVLDLLEELAAQTYLSVEYGLQSMHNRSLAWMNRGHDYDSFVDAVTRSANRGFEICAHVILGLPGESRADMVATARALADLAIDSVKIHNLYVVRDTPLAEEYAQGGIELLPRAEFIETLIDFLEVLPPDCIVERVAGDAPRDYLIAPAWCLDKAQLLVALRRRFEERQTWQGRLYAGR